MRELPDLAAQCPVTPVKVCGSPHLSGTTGIRSGGSGHCPKVGDRGTSWKWHLIPGHYTALFSSPATPRSAGDCHPRPGGTGVYDTPFTSMRRWWMAPSVPPLSPTVRGHPCRPRAPHKVRPHGCRPACSCHGVPPASLGLLIAVVRRGGYPTTTGIFVTRHQ